MSQGPVVWVEAIIGAGKSTLTEKLAEVLNLRPFYEPVKTNFYLESFYKDPKRWAFPMQIHLLHARLGIQNLAFAEAEVREKWAGSLLDRGLPGDRVFCKLHMLYGNMSENEWKTYEFCYSNMTHNMERPSCLIFLDVEPEVALERIKNRGRVAEKEITLKYLSDLRKGYLDLIAEMEHGCNYWPLKTEVKRIAWNQDHLPISPIVTYLSERFKLPIKEGFTA